MGNPETMYSASPSGLEGALRQGEILSHVVELQFVLDDSIGTTGRLELDADAIKHPFAIIVSQDCDLEQDFNFRFNDVGNVRHELPSILFCQVMEAKQFIKGPHNHLFNSSTFKGNFEKNIDFRFHFLQEVPAEFDLFRDGVPELAMEFKRCFSMPTAEIYHRIEMSHTQRRCRLQSPYVEHFCDRFYNFNKRIALPEEYQSI